MTITEFLTARLDEDEAVARDLVRTLAESIAFSMYPDQTVMDDPELVESFEGAAEKALSDFGMTPARVLTDVAAKRAIMAMHQPEATDAGDECSMCSFHELYEGFNDVSESWPCLTLRHLATVYAEHADWREEWRP